MVILEQKPPEVQIPDSLLVRTIKQRVNTLMDDEVDATYGDLHIIETVKETEPGSFEIIYIPTSPFCPFAFRMAQNIKKVALSVNGVKKVAVYAKEHILEARINKIMNSELPKRGPKPGSKRKPKTDETIPTVSLPLTQ